MYSKQESQPCSAALPAAKEELRIVPISHDEIQRSPDLSAKIRLNLCPISVRPQSPVQLLEQRHNSIELLHQDFIRNGLRCCFHLPPSFDCSLSSTKFSSFLLSALAKLRHPAFQRLDLIYCIRRFQYGKRPFQTNNARLLFEQQFLRSLAGRRRIFEPESGVGLADRSQRALQPETPPLKFRISLIGHSKSLVRSCCFRSSLGYRGCGCREPLAACCKSRSGSSNPRSKFGLCARSVTQRTVSLYQTDSFSVLQDRRNMCSEFITLLFRDIRLGSQSQPLLCQCLILGGLLSSRASAVPLLPSSRRREECSLIVQFFQPRAHGIQLL